MRGNQPGSVLSSARRLWRRIGLGVVLAVVTGLLAVSHPLGHLAFATNASLDSQAACQPHQPGAIPAPCFGPPAAGPNAQQRSSPPGSGTVWTWGAADNGQLGVGGGSGIAGDSLTPVQVCAAGQTAPCSSFLGDVGAIAVGRSHNLALKADGTVWAWGDGAGGELGNGTRSSSSTPVQVCAAGQTAPCRTFLNDVSAIAAGYAHNLALKADGTVWAWGDGAGGDLGNGSNASSLTPVQVCAAGQTAPCSSFLGDVGAIAAGGVHSMVLKKDHTVWAWGGQTHGELGNGSTVTASNTPVQVCAAGQTAPCSSFLGGVSAIAAGYEHNLALKADDGSVWAWGRGDSGQLGNGGTIDSSTPVQVCAAGQTAPCRSFLGGVSAIPAGHFPIAAGEVHSMALKADGTVWVWGIGFSGELGNGIRTSSPTPVQVCAAGQTAPCTSFLDRASDIGAGYSDSVALVDATTPSPSPSPSPQATTVTLSAACAPAGAAGSFGLQIGSTTSTAGCGGSNGPVTVTAGQLVTVAETIAAGSFTASLQCGSQPPVSSSGASVMATITPAAGSNTACTVTNTRCMAGDVNCSTKVDAVDALCVLRTVAALALTSACPFTPAGQTDPVWKLSTGSQISAVDALCILRSVAGLDGTAACPKLTIPQGAAASHAGPAGAPLRPTASAAPAHGSFLRPEPSLARLTAKWKA